MQWLLPLSILILFEAVADILAKEYAQRNSWWYGGAALLGYLLANTSWLIALKAGSGLGRGAVIFSVASAILAVLIGVVLYKEQVTPIQLVGMLLGVVAIGLIFWE